MDRQLNQCWSSDWWNEPSQCCGDVFHWWKWLDIQCWVRHSNVYVQLSTSDKTKYLLGGWWLQFSNNFNIMMVMPKNFLGWWANWTAGFDIQLLYQMSQKQISLFSYMYSLSLVWRPQTLPRPASGASLSFKYIVHKILWLLMMHNMKHFAHYSLLLQW